MHVKMTKVTNLQYYEHYTALTRQLGVFLRERAVDFLHFWIAPPYLKSLVGAYTLYNMMQKQHQSGIELVDDLAVQEISHLTTFMFATDSMIVLQKIWSGWQPDGWSETTHYLYCYQDMHHSVVSDGDGI